MPDPVAFDPDQRPKRDGESPPIPDHELIRCIGRGSYGEVWLARNVLGELRAAKVVHRRALGDNRPFEREFEGIQRYEPLSRSHQSQVQILHVGRNDARGYFYYVMELADDAGENPKPDVRRSKGTQSPKSENTGVATPALRVSDFGRPSYFGPRNLDLYIPRTLLEELERYGRLPVADCSDIGLALTTALEHLHSNGLVHRDIKPSNIIFVKGRPKLADIGLVTNVGDAKSIVGTEGYLAPEGPGTPQADLYSLGKVLYEISTGCDRKRFPDLPLDLQEWPERKNLVELNEILLKACDRDPRQRYQSAAEMRTELELLHRGKSVQRRRAAQRSWAAARRVGFATAMVAVLVAGGWLLSSRFNTATIQRSNTRQPEVNSIAVLPFINQSTWPGHEYLSDALTDQIAGVFTNIPGLRVAPRTATADLKRATNIGPSVIGEQLSVRSVLSGTFLRTSNAMQITSRLCNVADGSERWSTNIRRQRDELHLLAEDVVRPVVDALGLRVEEGAMERLQRNLARKMEAYRFYSQALSYPRNTKAGLNKQFELLNQAVLTDAEFAHAYAELATTYMESCEVILPPSQAMTEARKNATRALQINPSLAGPHLTLGWVLFNYDWEVAQAEIMLRRAVSLAPPGADASRSFAAFFLCLSRFEEADALLREAEQSDPSKPAMHDMWCWRYFCDHRFQEQLQAANRLLAVSSNNFGGVMHLAWALERLGDLEGALLEARRLVELDAAPDTISFLGFVQARRGERAEAEKVLERLKEMAETGYVSGFFPALIWVGLGETNRALDCLEQAVQQRSARVINQLVDPRLDPLRSHPRFQVFAKKLMPAK